jgi:galactofuranose transport system permease protein
VRLSLAKTQIPLAATVLVCIVLYVGAGLQFPAFFSLRAVRNLIVNNSVLGIAAVGMTFVILSGGIDLSVGAVVGCTSILLAWLIQKAGVHPALAIPVAVALGGLFGALQGSLISFYALPPFLVTLGGMFLARGLGFIISRESVAIEHPFYDWVSDIPIPLEARVDLPLYAVVFLLTVLTGMYMTYFTRFGRNTFAIGGSETSALLMGLPVPSTKLAIYSLGGFCSALAGVAHTFALASGNPVAGTMLELDVIAAVVIGGTLLRGGVGSVLGTFLGVAIMGIIQTVIVSQGTLSSWWTKIALGVLVLMFILLQKLVQWKL